ncbi:MAG: SH3 domain-containing protein, partial [Chitinispirillaceae bacterium]|nr:SH3 domain-containing protein [Chitinispirillaceae bacterium]
KAFAAQTEIEVTSYYAKVYVAPSTNANFIGLTQKGERYPLLGKREGWYYIRFKNANGWIEIAHVQVVDPTAPPPPAATAETPPSETNISPSSQVSTPSGATPISTSPSVDTTTYKEERSSTTKSQSVEESKSGIKPVETSSYLSTENRTSYPKREKTSPSKPVEKKESGIRSWFTQQNLPELPASVIPETSDESHLKYFQVRLPTKVIAFLSPDAPSLGMAKRGLILPIIAEGESWCRVAFNDTVGWIEKRYGRIIDPEKSTSLDFVKIGITLAVVAIIGIVIIVFIRILIGRKNRIGENIVERKEVLIVAKGSKVIQYTLTNGTTTIDRCFSEIGFSISFLHTISDI